MPLTVILRRYLRSLPNITADMAKDDHEIGYLAPHEQT